MAPVLGVRHIQGDGGSRAEWTIQIWEVFILWWSAWPSLFFWLIPRRGGKGGKTKQTVKKIYNKIFKKICYTSHVPHLLLQTNNLKNTHAKKKKQTTTDKFILLTVTLCVSWLITCVGRQKQQSNKQSKTNRQKQQQNHSLLKKEYQNPC